MTTATLPLIRQAPAHPSIPPTGPLATLPAPVTATSLLLASLDASGRQLLPTQQLQPALTAAAILDAEHAGLLRVERDGRHPVLRRTGAAAGGEATLLRAIVAACDGRTIHRAIHRIAVSSWAGAAIDVHGHVVTLLAEQGLLERRNSSRFGVGMARWRVDPAAQSAALAPLLAVLAGDVRVGRASLAVRRLAASAAVAPRLPHRIAAAHEPAWRASSPKDVRSRSREALHGEPVALAARRAVEATIAA